MKDLMYVADTKDQWREYAIAQGIAHAEQTDNGLLLVYNPGFIGDHIGPIGDDTRFHVNLRVFLDDEQRERIITHRIARPLTEDGVTWVDPSTVLAPNRIWFGGMDYFDPAGQAPFNIEAPFLDQNTAEVTDVVRCSPGEWSGSPTFMYRWMSDGEDLPQAVTAQHTVKLTDKGHTLTCRVTATNEHGEVSEVSDECVVP